MTPHKSHDRGSYLIDRVFPGVGRVRRASGTTDPRIYRELDAMLTILSVQGRHDLLEGLRDGKLKAIYVFTWFRQSRIDRIPTADVLPALKTTWDAWAAHLECSEEHRRSIGITGRVIGILAPHILSNLPALVADYAASGPRRMVQLARAHAMAFVRDILGPSHRLWGALKDVRVPKQTATRKGRPLSREEVRDLLKSFGDDGAGETWAMVVTGMHQKEYWGDWAVTGDRVAVHGTKRAGRDRVVPYWTPIVRPGMTRRRWENRLRAVTSGAVIPRDLRRTFARWCEEAGVTETNAEAYMGHKARTMTQLYRIGELPGQLAADGAKLAAYAGTDLVRWGLKAV